MSTPECTPGSLLQLTAVLVFIGYILWIIRKYFVKPVPRIIVVDDDITTLGRDFSPDEINAILRFKEYLLELQDLAQKTTEEKAHFSESNKDFNIETEHALIEMSKECTTVQKTINEAIEYKKHRTDNQFEQTEKLINNLEREIFIFKNSLDKCSHEKKQFQVRTPCKILVEETTQTNEEDPSSKEIRTFSLEMLTDDNVSYILSTIKDCMDTIVEESGSNWKITTEEVSKFLRGNHDGIKSQLVVSVAEYLEKNNQLQISNCESVLFQTANIEKQLFDVFLFLDRQLVDAQAVAETLRFFNRKFVHFAQKCDKRWEDSCSNYMTTCNRVQEAQENMNFSSSKMSRISCTFKQHTETMENLLKVCDAISRSVATVVATGDFGAQGKDHIEAACYTITELGCRVLKVEDVYRFNMTCILELIEKSSKKLESLLQYIEELGILSDFVRSITKTYESMISCTAAESGLFGDFKDCESIQEEDVCLDGDRMEMFSFGDASQAMMDCQNGSLEGVSQRRIISMLNDVIKKTASKMYKRRNTVIHGEVNKKESWMQPFTQAESKMKHLNIWDSVPSETALSEINSDCLLPKSSDSSIDEE